MRRICAVFAGVLLLLGLTACGGGEEGTSSAGTLAESALSQLEEAESELEVMTVGTACRNTRCSTSRAACP